MCSTAAKPPTQVAGPIHWTVLSTGRKRDQATAALEHHKFLQFNHPMIFLVKRKIKNQKRKTKGRRWNYEARPTSSLIMERAHERSPDTCVPHAKGTVRANCRVYNHRVDTSDWLWDRRCTGPRSQPEIVLPWWCWRNGPRVGAHGEVESGCG